jgi:glycoside/pentoside/hexuronide:cation symporter, GPH family
MASTPTNGPQLSFKTKLCYGLGNISIMMGKLAPRELALPIYNVLLGVSPSAMGWVLGLGRLVDAFTDPLTGNVSDRAATRWGRRRPFILLGVILVGLFFTTLWWFPRGLTPSAYLLYFIGVALLYYISLSVFSVPWYALGYELAPDYDQRTRLMAFAGFLGPIGQMTVCWMYRLTQLDVFRDDRIYRLTHLEVFRGDATTTGLRLVSLGAGVLIAGFGIVTAVFVRERSAGPASAKPRPSFMAGARAAAQSPAFVRLTVAFVLIQLGIQMVGVLGFYNFVYYLNGGDKKAGSLLLACHNTVWLASNMVFTPLIARLTARFGKKEIFLAAIVWGILRMGVMWFLMDPAHPWGMLVNGALMGADNAAIFMLCHAMIADICDVDERDSGHRREGLYGSLYSWAFKVGIALAQLVSGYILVGIGFDRALGGAQTAHTLGLMKLSYCAVPTAFSLLALLVFVRYPISRRVAQEVRAELDARKAAATNSPT